ncbi:MAG: glycosyltransferase [Phycisphaerales bacterium]
MLQDADQPAETTHVLLTRFNVRVRAKWSQLNNDERWLAGRFDLFETYCLPSVQHQTCADFVWLVYFDPGTPEPFMSRAREALERVPQARLVTIEAFDRELWMAPILEAVPSSASRLITTRLDNDDGLHPRFLERVRAAARTVSTPTFINLPTGCALRDGRLYRVTDRSNAFLSLVERVDVGGEPETVWVKPHTEAHAFAPIVQAEGEPAWLQVIHGENVSNRVRGVRVRATGLHGFGLTAAEESPWAILADNLSLYPGRAARSLAAAAARGVRRATR